MKTYLPFMEPAELERFIAIEIFDLPRKNKWTGDGRVQKGDPIWFNAASFPITCPQYARDERVAFRELIPWLFQNNVTAWLIIRSNEDKVGKYKLGLVENNGGLPIPIQIEPEGLYHPTAGVAIANSCLAYHRLVINKP